jgi:predicted ATPase
MVEAMGQLNARMSQEHGVHLDMRLGITEAGLTEQALGYWQRAGQHALARSANTGAIRHLTTGLALLATLPDISARPPKSCCC